MNTSEEGSFNFRRQELTFSDPGLVVRQRTGNDRSPGRNKAAPKKTRFFAFERAVDENGVLNVEAGGSERVDVHSSDDDTFVERPLRRSGKSKGIQKSVWTESKERAQRKRKKADDDLAVRKRELAGKKPFYIMVNALGVPYGDGLMAWRAEVNKLSRALDPSIRDVRQQLHQKIELLKKRLTDNFDYSGVISDKILLPIIGHNVSARRNDLMNAIRAGEKCPSGMDKDIWDRLVDISRSPNFQRKSAAMRYANACRLNLGRTGPSGEIRVRDNLKYMLRRSPDPEEVQAEMTRDKGYGGEKKKTKRMVVREKAEAGNSQLTEQGGDKDSQGPQQLLAIELPVASEKMLPSSVGEGVKETSADQMELIRRLQAEIHELKSRMENNASQDFSFRTEAAVQAMTVPAPVSSGPGIIDQMRYLLRGGSSINL